MKELPEREALRIIRETAESAMDESERRDQDSHELMESMLADLLTVRVIAEEALEGKNNPMYLAGRAVGYVLAAIMGLGFIAVVATITWRIVQIVWGL